MTYDISIVQLEKQPTLVGKATVAPALLSARLAEILPAVAAHLGSVGVPPVGPPFTKYLQVSEAEMVIEAGMPVAQPLEAGKGVEPSSLPGGKVAQTVHVGPYDQLGHAHQALLDWITQQEFEASGDVWEVYITDPGQVPDPKDWQTLVFAGVK